MWFIPYKFSFYLCIRSNIFNESEIVYMAYGMTNDKERTNGNAFSTAQLKFINSMSLVERKEFYRLYEFQENKIENESIILLTLPFKWIEHIFIVYFK